MVFPYLNGNFYVFITGISDNEWDQLWVEENSGVFSNFETLNVRINISSYRNRNVKLKFQYIANDGDSVFLDDVTVSRNLLSSDQFEIQNEIKIHPNPIKNIVNLESENFNFEKARIFLIDSKGVELKNFKNEKIFDISSFPSGFYIIKVDDGENFYLKKIIKN